ncbi:MAG: hypothetical protein JNL81_13910 [Hyphomonadaceae bacterium]|nr:hypothetical protein [Hyphomonadaceae bacterium]
MVRTTALLIAGLSLALAACSPPRQAETPATTAETAVSLANVSSPVSGARVTTPVIVEGAAPGDWFFEAQFPVKLVAADGTVLAEAPARAQGEWVTEAHVAYRAELVFIVTGETQATLVLQEDMPADNANPREVTMPVVLAPR